MSERNQSAAVIIKRRHQSAPKATEADAAVMKAAQEIDSGQYVEEMDATSDTAMMDRLGIALTTGSLDEVQRMCRPGGQSFDEFAGAVAETALTTKLARHPRVQEALEKMQREAEEEGDPVQAMETRAAIWEMEERAVAKNKWAGQERWQGKDNLEMRKGELLTPWQFHDRLCKVIGNERVLLSTNFVKDNPAAKSARCALVVRNPLWDGDPMLKEVYPQQRAAQLRADGEKKLAEGKRMRLLGMDAQATKLINDAAAMGEGAIQILQQMEMRCDAAPKEFVRVGSLQGPLGTEWMVMNFDPYGVPTTARFLGWRTALLSMIRARVITEDEAHRAFPVGSGPAASWYLEQLFALRNLERAMN